MFRTLRLMTAGVVLVGLFTTAAAAQDRQVHVNLGGGPTFNMGDLGDYFSTGWGPAIGVTMNQGKMGLQFEYAGRWFDLSGDAPIPTPLSTSAFGANHKTHQLDFNVVIDLAESGSAVRPYVLAGPGAYYRSVEITKYEGTGIICDPFWYVCGTYPVSSVIGSRGGWDFGLNVGGGVGLRLAQATEFYIETRFHKVWGPDIQADDPAQLPASAAVSGQGGKADGNYLPLTFGLRFTF